MRLLCILAFLLVSPVNCLAGYLGETLQEKMISINASDEIPVIVYFKTDTARNASFNSVRNRLKTLKASDFKDKKAFKKARKAMRRQYIEAKKSEADFSNRHFKKILRQYKKNIDHDLWLINALAIKLPAHLINTFSNQPQVDHIDLDAVIKLSGNNVSASTSPPTWNLNLVKAPSLWDEGINGTGIVIASMDTGVDGQHPDLASSWRGGNNSWFDPYGTYTQPHDGTGHGTQVMGVMVGGDFSGDSIGVAPGAQWISVKIFKNDGSAWFSAIHAGFQWLLDPDGDPNTDDAPDIVNNSWGVVSSLPTCDTEFHQVIDDLKLAGIEVVFSAGNGGPLDNSLYSPADYVEVVSVGSVDIGMNVANTSSRGPSNCHPQPPGEPPVEYFPNLAAPGVGIYTTDLSPFGAQYDTVDGTSFAAPHLTGIIALLKSAVPTATNNDIRNALYSTALDLGAPGPDDITGYGMVDAHQALLTLRCSTGTTDSDADGWYDACDNCITVSNNSQLDTDGDNYGNACDADLNGDLMVNLSDFSQFRNVFGSADPDADFNGDGSVNLSDFSIFRDLFGSAPGPSGIAN